MYLLEYLWPPHCCDQDSGSSVDNPRLSLYGQNSLMANGTCTFSVGQPYTIRVANVNKVSS